jgi:hypothetical protein
MDIARAPRAFAACAAVIGVSALSLAGPPAGSASPRVGIGDQRAQMFSDPHFRQLALRRARLVVPWDWYKKPADSSRVYQWLGAAQATKVTPLVAFEHSRVRPHQLPSTTAYQTSVRLFRRTFPWVREYSPWNEVNNGNQPTYRKPKMAAFYYNVVRANCRTCTIVAADILDVGRFQAYLRTFLRYAKGKPRLWGLHNYRDSNRFRSTGTRAMLRAVRGKVWLTETGGIVKFGNTLPWSTRRAAKATKYMFQLARISSRIKRVYIYTWLGQKRSAHFDAGLVDRRSKPRPAYYVVRNALRRLPR